MKETAQITEALLEKPYSFAISDRETPYKKREFVIKPPCLACLMAIGCELATVDFKKIVNDKNLSMVAEYTDTMVKVVCLIIENHDHYPPELFDYVKQNLTAAELYELFTEAVLRLGTANFRKSIILSRQMSLLTLGSPIAPSTHGHS